MRRSHARISRRRAADRSRSRARVLVVQRRGLGDAPGVAEAIDQRAQSTLAQRGAARRRGSLESRCSRNATSTAPALAHAVTSASTSAGW